MATLVLKDLPEAETAALRARAARNGRSFEAELRAERKASDLAGAINRRFAPYGGVELPTVPRTPDREPPHFD